MMFISGLLKQVAKGAAVQLGVSAVHEAVWPRVKKFGSKLLDRAAEHKNKEQLEELLENTEKQSSEGESAE